MKIGLDVGSTTIKCVVLKDDKIIYESYERHFSKIKEKVLELLTKLNNDVIKNTPCQIAMSGSACMGLAEKINVEFVQEVYATRIAAKKFLPQTDCIIELGGEDAKILFLTDGLEVRMNGSCAGGTGAFIDQMATLLNIDIPTMNELAQKHTKVYNIASRCGVFAKTDIQPLINQGAKKEDISKSIFNAVVNQTIGGLAQGREIKGNIVYLGGPLTFISELRESFDEALHLHGTSPLNSLYYVAIGTALCANKVINLETIIENLKAMKSEPTYKNHEPLFNNMEEYNEFKNRHNKAKVNLLPLDKYDGRLFLGIDSGSTTLKMVLIDEDANIRFEKYMPNKGNPVTIIKDVLIGLYETYPNLNIAYATSTGYGEELIKAAFNLDDGIVETIAHFTAAKKFMPDVEFIIDIGGQDIKCFKIENNVISNIFLNEACSSGCGSFLQTFANALGYDVKEFAKLGLFAKKPVELGSRCTVFMNSSVKEAQKEGATIDNISAGLSISVVKNALYKVIRTANKEELGKKIVVQGGTFHNEAVLRAFEKELNVDVVCPNISGIMGAYGAALYGLNKKNTTKSSIITLNELKEFVHSVRNINCGGCANNCNLSINTFKNKNRYISGNRCDVPLNKKIFDNSLNIYSFIQDKLLSYQPVLGGKSIGIPLVLNNYELFPFFYTLFTNLGFAVYNSGFSNAKLYLKGQHTIPSDTACFPAKLVHGHIEKLMDANYDYIFYPCMSYNIDEYFGDNHYNCPVVAYYPEQIKNNVKNLDLNRYITGYIDLSKREYFYDKFYELLLKYDIKVNKKALIKAINLAYDEYDNYLKEIKAKGQAIIDQCRSQGKQIICLAGRPYHVDPEVNHGIDKLILGLNVGIVNEEALCHLIERQNTNILNQWTYHSRLFQAANYIATQKDMQLIQLVSFGCGLDAITTDEVKSILESHNKIYTQIKIDEITNLGAVKIRLRSLFGALEMED